MKEIDDPLDKNLKALFEHQKRIDAKEQVPTFDEIAGEQTPSSTRVWYYAAASVSLILMLSWWVLFPTIQQHEQPVMQIILTYEHIEDGNKTVTVEQSLDQWQSETDIFLIGL